MASRRDIIALLDELAPQVRAAFLAAVNDMRADVNFAALQAAIARGDIEAAIAALRLDAAQVEPLRRAIEAAFAAGGDLTAGALVASAAAQGASLAVRFDARNPRAEQILRRVSSSLVTEIVDETREAIRERLEAGAIAGRGPRATALELVGRIKDGKRQGGIIGLTRQQAQWIENARREILSGDPAQMTRYLQRAGRDKRFDPIIRRAIRAGGAVSQSDASRIVSRYSDRILKYRGDVIARTETLAALHAAQDEGLQQWIASGKVSAAQITRTWDAAEDKYTRPTHAAMDGQKRKMNEPFMSPSGVALLYPGAAVPGQSRRATAAETIQCRCRVRVSVDWAGGLRRGGQ